MSGNRIIRIFFTVILACCFIFYWKMHNMNMKYSEYKAIQYEFYMDWIERNPDFEPEAEWLERYPEFKEYFANRPARPAEESTPAESAESGEAPAEAAAPEEVAAEQPQGRADGLPDVDLTAWNLILVNKEEANSFDDRETPPPLTDFEGHKLDERIIEELSAFVSAARAEGLSVVINSGYRSYSDQSANFNNKLQQTGDYATAANIVFPPAHSEHETGLCLDVADQYYNPKTVAIAETATYKWLSAHCQEYGFIVRYPEDKTEITGCMYEPWHFRYVGKEAAEYIMANGLCLEEFHELYK